MCRVFSACATVFWVCACAHAEVGCGSVAGTVFEADGHAAPLANVALVNQGNGLHRELIAAPDGKYRLGQLPAGSYVVGARSSITGAFKRVSVKVSECQTTNLPIYLPATWSVLEPKDLRELPLIDNSYLNVISQASEVTRGEEGGNIEGYTPYSPRGNSSLNSLGQRGQDNDFLMDGIDNNESWLRGPILDPPVEAIASVVFDQVYIPADFGHATGSVVDVHTRSGSIQFHGSGFDYLQNSVPNARNFFDGAEKPGLVRNQFGGSLGGPLRKNDFFFFLTLDSLRMRQGLTVISTVPTVAQKSGNFGATPIYDPLSITEVGENLFTRQPFADNQIPPERISQPARNLIALYPDPNLPGTANNYRFTPSLIQNSDRVDARIDKVLSFRSTLFGRLSYERQDKQSPGALPAPRGLSLPTGSIGSDSSQHADGANTDLAAWGGVISDELVLQPSLINQFRLGIACFHLMGSANDQGLNAAAVLGIPGLGTNGLPVIDPVGFTHLGAAEAVPMQILTTNYEVQDSVFWKTGRHAWEFGLQVIRRHADGQASEWTDRGTFSFTPDYTGLPGIFNTGDSIASLLLGFPSEVRRDVQFAPFRLRAWEWDGFVQDQIQIVRKLTVQAGLRYSLYPPLTEAQNRMVNFNDDQTEPALNHFAGQGGVNQYAGLEVNKVALAPRVGFVLNLFREGSTLLRGGFSKDYDPGPYAVEGILAQNPPFASRLDMINGTFQVGPNLSAGLPAPAAVPLLNVASLNAAQGAIYAIESHHFKPNAEQWGLFLQQRLGSRFKLEIGGTGSMGMHLFETYDSNQPYPAPIPYSYPRHPYAYDSRIDYLSFAGGSTYYGGQAKLYGQLASGLQLLMTYRYAKSLDDSTVPGSNQDSRPSGPQYIYYLRGNRSVSPFDIQQRLVVMASHDLPFKNRTGHGSGSSRFLQGVLADWRASTIIMAQTGLPFTPELAVNSLNNGGFQLPNRSGSGALPAGQSSYLHWFNTSLNPVDPSHAFTIPNLYQYGNSGFDILRGPGSATADISLSRSYQIQDRLRLLTRIEAFNFLNRANFALPNRILGVESSGVISHTSTPARQFQLATRVEW